MLKSTFEWHQHERGLDPSRRTVVLAYKASWQSLEWQIFILLAPFLFLWSAKNGDQSREENPMKKESSRGRRRDDGKKRLFPLNWPRQIFGHHRGNHKDKKITRKKFQACLPSQFWSSASYYVRVKKRADKSWATAHAPAFMKLRDK